MIETHAHEIAIIDDCAKVYVNGYYAVRCCIG